MSKTKLSITFTLTFDKLEEILTNAFYDGAHTEKGGKIGTSIDRRGKEYGTDKSVELIVKTIEESRFIRFEK